MKNVVKAFLKGFVLKVIPLWLYKHLVPGKLTSIFYHAVSDDSLPHIHNIYPVVNSQQFRGAIEYLLKRYKYVSYEEIEAGYEKGVSLPQNSVHLTFDDGFIECFSVIRPILLEYGIPATFFITTDFIGNKVLFTANLKSLLIEKVNKMDSTEFIRVKKKVEDHFNIGIESIEGLLNLINRIDRRDEKGWSIISDSFGFDSTAYLKDKPLYLNKEQIKKMKSEGFTIGAHSRSHFKLGLVDDKLMEEEIVESTKFIKKITGQKSIPFSFPNSGYGVDREKLKQIRKDNPELGLLFDSKGFNHDAAFIINRIWGEHPSFIRDDNKHKMQKIIHSAYQEAFFLKLSSIFQRSKTKAS